MRTDVDRHHNAAFDVKDNAQIGFDFCRTDRMCITSGKTVNLLGTQALSKRSLLGGQLVETARKRASRALMTEARQLKAAYQFYGLKPLDRLRATR